MSWLFPAIALAFLPKEGVVPNAETAVKIAEAVATSIYGEETIRKELPLVATLRNDIWTVIGTLHGGKFTRGGVVRVEIKKASGEVLEITHGK